MPEVESIKGVGTALEQTLEEIKEVQDRFKNISVSKKLTAEENTSGLTLSLDLNGRDKFSVIVENPGYANEVFVYHSIDNINFKVLDVFSFMDRTFKSYQTNLRYVKVEARRTEIPVEMILSSVG